GFWRVVALGVLFTLARFSEAFLVLKAHAVGLPLALAPAVLVAMNVVYALGAYPAGLLADRAPARGPLFAALAALVVADLLLAVASDLTLTFAGIALWGLHMAFSQGLLAKLVADHAPAALRGSAFGLFNLATGVAMLAASALAGLLWDGFGAAGAFGGGALFAAAAALFLLLARDLAPRDGLE
ncbi:MAG: MFS transporter, partial [Gammaproteobacteria bacterium]